MRFRFTTFIVFVFALSSFAQKTEKKFSVGQKAEMLIGVLNNNHCQAQKIDDAYSKVLFNDLIEGLNAEKSTFTSADIKTLSKYETLLDDQIKSKNISFIPELMKVFKSRAMSLDTLITKICERPINFETKFTFVPKYDSVATSDSELKVRLQRNLKYSIFENLYYNLLDTTSYKLSKEYLDYPKLKIQEAASREKIKLRYKNAIKRSLDYINEENLENYFLNTMAQTYDNHTEFFDIKAAENYVNSTNPNDEVFGFSFGQNKKAEVIIGDILPGGPAWNSGLINIGDLVLNITFDNKKSVNVLGNDLMEIETIFEDNETPKISLTLRKSTNEIVKVDLVKEHVVNEEETVRSLILENKANFGYINLPAFYSDNESDNTSGCANNVARELIKMREDNIKGLILDLRFNGGGSVNEALDLAGIFIDQGIFGAGKPGKGKSILLKDPNRGSIYDGPLIVLINQASASASEILAGILQDYNRAVIVGSKSYGKGVAQIVVPLDSLSKEPMFYAKTTVWRVFRPSGKAIQHEGVKPDINLPSILDYSEFSEKPILNP